MHCGILCDFETKGTVTTPEKSGRLAKLPFTAWKSSDLEEFEDCEVITVDQLKEICEKIETGLDSAKIEATKQQRETLKQNETIEAKLRDVWQYVGSYIENHKHSPISSWRHVVIQRVQNCLQSAQQQQNADVLVPRLVEYLREILPKSIYQSHENATLNTPPAYPCAIQAPVASPNGESPSARITQPISASSATPCGRGATISPRQSELLDSDDAFERSKHHLQSFIVDFYRVYQEYPSTENALEFLQHHGLYSGEWSENETAREQRVSNILDFFHQSFDPSKIRTEGKPVDLHRNRFSAWVKRHYGDGICEIERKLNHIDLTWQEKEVFVPAKFIEHFLSVIQVCLLDDPANNNGVATNRIKELWTKVEGGVSWNQRYFQIVRDRLDRDGVISIYDREHRPGKCWRWECGQLFPIKKSYPAKYRAFVDEAVPLESFLSTTHTTTYNTLYHDDDVNLENWASLNHFRPPP